jgi:hypothetical protein
MDPEGNHVGYLSPKKLIDDSFLAEEAGHIGTAVKRQFLHSHRSFKAHILDKEGNQILYVCFPFSHANTSSNVPSV